MAQIEIVNLRGLVDDRITENVAVQETHEAKQEVLDAISYVELVAGQVTTAVANGKIEITDHTDTKSGEITALVETKVAEIVSAKDDAEQEYNLNAADRLQEYDDSHTTKIAEYDLNATTKLEQYNYNHTERLDDLNYAYADRIVDMLNTKRLLGMVDQYFVNQTTQMATFMSTNDPDYTYYVNGVKLEVDADYTIYDDTTIELTTPINPYDVVLQINTRLLGELLIHEGVLFRDEIGQPNGIAGLNAIGQVPAEQLPSYVDDVLEVDTYADLPVVGEAGKIYVVVADETSNGDTSSYRWTGSVYVMVSNTLTAADIKSLYESNADTNVYTDAEKALVDVGTTLDTTATTLVTALNEVHGELDTEVNRATVQEDTIKAGVGLAADGTYISRVGSNYLDTATDVVDEITLLDVQAKVEEAMRVSMQGAIGASVDTNGAYVVDDSAGTPVTNYLQDNASITEDIRDLDIELKSHVDSITAHMASSIPTIANGNLSETNVQLALEEIYNGTAVKEI